VGTSSGERALVRPDGSLFWVDIVGDASTRSRRVPDSINLATREIATSIGLRRMERPLWGSAARGVLDYDDHFDLLA